MNGDWLESTAGGDWLSDEELAATAQRIENAEKVAAQKAVDDVRAQAVVPVVRSEAELPVDAKKRSELLMECWGRLTDQKKMFLSMLRENHFNIRKTVRALETTNQSVSRTTVRRWVEEDEDYAFVLNVMTAVEVGDVVKKERLLLRADEIADEALAPKPILFRGVPTGYHENHPDTALRANEQLMKATGLLRESAQSTRVVVRFVNLAGPEEADAIDVAAEVVQ